MARAWAWLRVIFGRHELKPERYDMNKQALKPDRKVGHALAIGTPAGAIVAWIITASIGVDVPEPIATAFGGLFAGLWAYFTRNA